MAAPERQRDPDAEFVGTFREPPAFEDLSERMAVKLTSMLRLTGPPHYELWQREIGGPHFKERTGQFLPIYHLDVEVTDAPIETRQMLDVAVRIRLGKEIGADGRVERLLSEADTELTAPTAAGGRVRLGRTRKQSIFTRADPDPARRRVTTLHPSFGLGELPRRELRAVKPDELLAPPADGRHLGALGPGPSHAWSYQQTDPNRHVHAMEYLRVVEAFATTELARAGRLPADYLIARARIVFRRPCFSGEWYRVTGERWAVPGPGGEEIVAAVHPIAGPDAAPTGRPATIVRLAIRARPAAGR